MISTVTITAAGQWTDWIHIPGKALLTIRDTDSMSMTITLQCRKQGTTNTVTADTKTAEGAWLLECGGGREWRAGCDDGGFTSGQCIVDLGF